MAIRNWWLFCDAPRTFRIKTPDCTSADSTDAPVAAVTSYPAGMANSNCQGSPCTTEISELAIPAGYEVDRKSTRLNSSHITISYAAPTVYTLSLHDALPIYQELVAFLRRTSHLQNQNPGLHFRRLHGRSSRCGDFVSGGNGQFELPGVTLHHGNIRIGHSRRIRSRSEEHTSELQSHHDLVCRSHSLHSFPTRRSSDLSGIGGFFATHLAPSESKPRIALPPTPRTLQSLR